MTAAGHAHLADRHIRDRRGVPIDHDHLEALCDEYARTRCDELRRTILEGHEWLVRICAKQMMRRAESLDDLVQVGNIGLIKALERFDPAFRVRFRTFASVTIDGELRRYFRSTWRIHVPRSVQERHHAVSRAIETLTATNSSSPSVDQIADFLGVSESEVLEAMGAGAAFAPAPLEGDRRGDERTTVVLDGRSAHSFDAAEHRMVLLTLLGELAERERRVVYLRYFEDHTQLEIARELGISQVHVSRLLRAALERMRSIAVRGASDQALLAG